MDENQTDLLSTVYFWIYPHMKSEARTPCFHGILGKCARRGAMALSRELINPCPTEFILRNIKLYLHFVLFLNVEMVQVVEILPCEWEGHANLI